MPAHFKHAVRTLLKDRGFTAAAVLMIAVGIGANAAMFSIVRAVLLRPLGFSDVDRVVMLWSRNLQRDQAVGEMTFRDYQEFRRRIDSFAEFAVIGSVNWPGTLRIDGGEPFGVPMNAVSATFFDVLGARPLLGRTFRADEDEPTSSRVMVLSHGLWTRQFGGDPGVIGRTVAVKQPRGEERFEIVGVMPPEFFFPRGAEYWTPAAPELAALARAEGVRPEEYFQGFGVFYGVGRLNPGITVDGAAADANTALRALYSEHKRDPTGLDVALTPVLDHIFGHARRALQVLMGAVAVVLLIVCTNVASLLLARGAARKREMALRAALGASRGRIVRQLLVESAVLCAAGAILGVMAAALSLDALVALSPAEIPRLDAATLDRGVLTFALVITAATAMVLGLAPARRLSAPSLLEDLKGAASGATGRSTAARTRQTLVAVQVAGSVVLLVAAGLCVQSFGRINRIELGFDPRNVLTFSITGLEERYPDTDQRAEAVEQLLARFERLPHVREAGAIYQRPFEHGPIGWDSGVILEGQPLTAPDTAMRNPLLNWESVTPGYFDAMGIRLLRGRTFDDRDTRNSPPAVIVSEAAATRLWPGEDPIGKRILAKGARLDEQRRPIWQTIVGVVETARYREIESPRFDMYVPLRQADSFVQHFVVRTATDPAALAPTLRAETSSFDRRLSLDGVTTMEEIVGRTKGPWRFNMLVFSAFGLIALGLAAVGLFALVAYAVSQRTREIGVRVALGAAPGDVIRLVLSQGATFALIGLGCGLLAALLTTRLIAGLLFAVSATDPATFVTAAGVLLVVALLASYLPARRAAAVDPLVALRNE